MKNIVDALLRFRETQDQSLILTGNKSVSQEELNVIAIEILSWLKLEYKRELWMENRRRMQLKPLHLDYNYSWCNTLRDLTVADSIFTEIFCTDGDSFGFVDSVKDDERHSLREDAYNNYNPIKMI